MMPNPHPTHKRSLRYTPSKLDLIDDTTLTSLPLPPPLKPRLSASKSSMVLLSGAAHNTIAMKKKLNKHLAGRRLFNNVNSSTNLLVSAQPLRHTLNEALVSFADDPVAHHRLPLNQVAPECLDATVDLDAADELDGNVTIESFDQEYEEDDTEYDEEGNESSDPIVLIEDYMRNHSSSLEPTPDPQETGFSQNGGLEKTRSSSDGLVSTRLLALHDPIANDACSIPNVSTSPDDLHMCNLMTRKRSIAAFKLKYHAQNILAGDDQERCLASETKDQFVNVASTSPIFSHHTEASDESYGLQSSTANTTFSHSLLKKRSISADSYTYKSEDLQEIFGKIPGADLLKHCDLCDKPLYEVSSIIMNHNKKRAKKGGSSIVDSEECSPYLEFICGDCIGMYETFLNDFLQQYLEEQQAQQDRMLETKERALPSILPLETPPRQVAKLTSKIQVIAKKEDAKKVLQELSVLLSLAKNPRSERLVKLFREIRDKYDYAATQHPDDDNQNHHHRINGTGQRNSSSEREGFSPELISQFKHLNKHTSSNLLLKLIQSKLRWKWNYNDLVPTV